MVNNNFETLIEHEISQMNEVNVNDGNQEIDALFNVNVPELVIFAFVNDVITD